MTLEAIHTPIRILLQLREVICLCVCMYVCVWLYICMGSGLHHNQQDLLAGHSTDAVQSTVKAAENNDYEGLD